MKKGDKARVRGKHASAAHGETGTIHSVHSGVFYGFSSGNGIAYLPASHAEPVGTADNPDPDNDNDNDIPGSGGNTDAADWERAMDEVLGRL